MKEQIIRRIEQLRSYMAEKELSAFIIPSSDPHASEYTPDYWKAREWISGFTGSAGTIVITTEDAALWTDSRYFLQAAEQLEGTGIKLIKQGIPNTPSISEWLMSILYPGAIVGIDGWVNSITEVETLRDELMLAGIQLDATHNPIDEIWKDRPALSKEPVCEQPMEYAGVSRTDKIGMVLDALVEHEADAILLSSLDEIAWVLNLRGNDVHCNPVFVSYLLITYEETILFIDPDKITPELKATLKSQEVDISRYTDLQETLNLFPYKTLAVDSAHTSYAVAQLLNPQTRLIRCASPVAMLKAVKNECEIKGFHQAMLRDGVAMVKFLKWLEEAVPQGGQTEISVADKLYALRAEQPLFKGISFDTIAGYKEHGAIVHYEATPETDKALAPEGLLLLDSGAQYVDGTTDITRTIALGPLTDDEKKDYTLVLKGHIQLSRACFPKGTCGTQLDVLARAAMWCEGINYLHGTGHGVGSYLNVHEGPHQIRMNYMPAPLQPGMTVTDEPGIYQTGRYGIRTENTLLIVPYKQTEYGEFCAFEPLTLCPIDVRPIVTEMLNDEELTWLNNYHRHVYEKLSPMLDEEHRTWLKEKTAALTR